MDPPLMAHQSSLQLVTQFLTNRNLSFRNVHKGRKGAACKHLSGFSSGLRRPDCKFDRLGGNGLVGRLAGSDGTDWAKELPLVRQRQFGMLETKVVLCWC